MSRVLVVDDDLDGMEALCLFLERAGHEVVCKHNGREALAALPAVAPQVVILDLCMPEMDGVEFLQVLRNYYRGATMPVILLTALPGHVNVQRALKLGVSDVFAKADFRLSELAARITELTNPTGDVGFSTDPSQPGLST